MALGLLRTHAAARPVVVAQARQRAGGVAGLGRADAVGAGLAGDARIVAGAAVRVVGAQVVAAAVAEGHAVAGADGCGQGWGRVAVFCGGGGGGEAGGEAGHGAGEVGRD